MHHASPPSFALSGFGGVPLVAAKFLLRTMADTHFLHTAFGVL